MSFEEMDSCPNSKFCLQFQVPSSIFNVHRGTCPNCAISFGRVLAFSKEEIDCPVCLETTVDNMVHPSGCGHIFCISCVRRLFWPMMYREDTSKKYGAPQEEDFLDNIEEYEKAWEMWIETDMGKLWNSIDAEEELHLKSIEACPICRFQKEPDWKKNVVLGCQSSFRVSLKSLRV